MRGTRLRERLERVAFGAAVIGASGQALAAYLQRARAKPCARMPQWPASILVLVFLALPLLLLFRYSLNRFVPGQFMVETLTLENYAKCVTDPYYSAVLKTTLLMAIGVTLTCLVAGFPVALYLARTTVKFNAILILAVILPLFVGNAVRAAGWMVALLLPH